MCRQGTELCVYQGKVESSGSGPEMGAPLDSFCFCFTMMYVNEKISLFSPESLRTMKLCRHDGKI